MLRRGLLFLTVGTLVLVPVELVTVQTAGAGVEDLHDLDPVDAVEGRVRAVGHEGDVGGIELADARAHGFVAVFDDRAARGVANVFGFEVVDVDLEALEDGDEFAGGADFLEKVVGVVPDDGVGVAEVGEANPRPRTVVESQATASPAIQVEAKAVKIDVAKLDYLADMAGGMVIAQSLVRRTCS